MTREIASGTKDEDINIKNGRGSVDESQYTAGKAVMGYFIIQSPSRGTWDIVAEVNDETVMNRSGVSQGEKIPFKVKTSLWGETKLSISITWSNQANTTLTAHVHASYWACGQDSVFLFFCFVFFFSGVKYLCIYFSTIPTSYYEIILCASHYYWLCI